MYKKSKRIILGCCLAGVAEGGGKWNVMNGNVKMQCVWKCLFVSLKFPPFDLVIFAKNDPEELLVKLILQIEILLTEIWCRKSFFLCKLHCFEWIFLEIVLLLLLDVDGNDEYNWFRSIYGERLKGRTRRTLACWSTSVGRWRERPGWNLRSRRSICALVGQWS